MARKKREPLSARKLKAWQTDLERREKTLDYMRTQLDMEIERRSAGVNRFNQMVEANRAIKPKLRVQAISRPLNPGASK